MKKVIVLFLFVNCIVAQNLNSYKYVLLPSRFSCQTEVDQYNLNSLMRMILEKNGFEVYADNEKFTDDFATENCNKLYADLDVQNSMFVTKAKIVLKDCKNNIIFISAQGRSNEKIQTIAFAQALRTASQSLDAERHIYKPLNKVVPTLSDKNSIQPEPFASSDANYTAKKTNYGFDLIGTKSGTIFMSLQQTSLKGIYLASKNNKIHGIAFEKDNQWQLEYYKDDIKTIETLTILF